MGGSDVYSTTAPTADLCIIAATVASLNVPTGNYWILFTSTLTNTSTDLLTTSNSIGCEIVGFCFGLPFTFHGTSENNVLTAMKAAAVH